MCTDQTVNKYVSVSPLPIVINLHQYIPCLIQTKDFVRYFKIQLFMSMRIPRSSPACAEGRCDGGRREALSLLVGNQGILKQEIFYLILSVLFTSRQWKGSNDRVLRPGEVLSAGSSVEREDGSDRGGRTEKEEPTGPKGLCQSLVWWMIHLGRGCLATRGFPSSSHSPSHTLAVP